MSDLIKRKSYPIFSIAIEGPDGSGKTTLINELKKQFNVIDLPKSWIFGLMPMDLNERITWFRSENPFVTARIYMASHLLRLQLCKEYIAKRSHYEMIQYNRFEKPPLILIDRGPLSLQAYVYAYLRVDTQIEKRIIEDFVELQYKSLESFEPMMTILLSPENDMDAVKLVERLEDFPVSEKEREFKLIKEQIHYFNKNSYSNGIKIYNPFELPNQLTKAISEDIQKKLEEYEKSNKESVKSHSLKGKTFYLEDILEQLQVHSFNQNVYLVGGLIEKGYSDNDVDFVVEDKEDYEMLLTIYKDKTQHFHIDLVKPDEISSFFGGKERWILKL
jgi:thymidylate kinase